MKDTKPFDRFKVPPKQNIFFMPIIWLGCWLFTRGTGLKIVKSKKRGIKPPYLLLATHHSFTDFYVTPLALFPHRANYVSELEGFENYGEWLYRQVGCLGTRKFINDRGLIKNIKRVVDRGGILVLYPEARYANVGTSSELPLSVAKLIKMLKVPVVTLNMKGNYLQSPIWNLTTRKEVRLHTDMTYALTVDDIKNMTVQEIHKKISELLSYDEYAWQRESKMQITYKKRAEGLHLPLYQCRKCQMEFQMQSEKDKLYCSHCGTSWSMDAYGTLVNDTIGNQYIPDWYEWQRENVKREIDEDRYHLDMKVQVEALPNAKNFIPCGEGYIHHDKEGFVLTFWDYETNKEATLTVKSNTLFSIHTEYDYRKKGQCITLSIPDNTYFIYPLEKGFNATKIQFAVEYMNTL